MKNIFIVHSPFQLFVAERIVATNESFFGAENIVLLEIEQDISCSVDLWSKIHYLQYVGGSVLGRNSRKKSDKNTELLRRLIEGSNTVRILVSDIAWPQNNRVFFDKEISSKVKFSLIIDGIASYISPEVSLTNYFRGWLKGIIGATGFGVKYRPYTGKLMGEERAEIDKVFGFSAYALSCPEGKKIDIPIYDVSNHIQLNNRCLLLGQPFWRFMDDLEWEKIQSETLEFIMSIECDEVLYKAHHHDREVDSLFYQKKGISLLEDNRCIERIFADNYFSTVISYNSSALFNLKCMYGHNIRCISLSGYKLGIKTDLEKKAVSRMLKLLDEVGVELVDLI